MNRKKNYYIQRKDCGPVVGQYSDTLPTVSHLFSRFFKKKYDTRMRARPVVLHVSRALEAREHYNLTHTYVHMV